MKEIDKNKEAWSKMSEDHYHVFKKRLTENHTIINPIILEELGDISNKTLIHLQCNTGADTICLSREGAIVTGIDLSPSNIFYARKLADDFKVVDAQFFEANLMEFKNTPMKQYDIVFTSEGVLGWLPDLRKWAEVVSSLLKQGGIFYINEIHPFYLTFDEDAFMRQQLIVKYPYFGKTINQSNEIGGYASPSKKAECYDWMFSLSEVINVLIETGLEIIFVHEFDTLCYDLGGMEQVNTAQFQYPEFKNKLPLQFSIKAKKK